MPELTIISLFCRLPSRLQHIYHGQPMPVSTLTPCQSRLYPLVRDFEFDLWTACTHGMLKRTSCQCCQLFSRKSARLSKNAVSENFYFSINSEEKIKVTKLNENSTLFRPFLWKSGLNSNADHFFTQPIWVMWRKLWPVGNTCSLIWKVSDPDWLIATITASWLVVCIAGRIQV